ncbi:tetratricopeptide repeat protein [Thermodesulfobacteriota bacterium]
MAEQDFKRKLTAILSADVEGYSLLMRDDEEATVRTITEYREVIGPLVRKHRGEVVDSPGDNILAEFASVVDAVRSAVEVQEELKARNDELPENRRMEFRIGINLGDVIHEKERIYGDGVNVAARVESLADAGCICVSRSAYDQVKNKLALGYKYLGEHSAKNIAEPIRVYKVLMEPEYAGKVIGEKRVESKRGQRVALTVVIVLLLVVGGLLIWRTASPPVEVASVEKMAYPLPDKPSIAVLPFDNMSGDSEQEYIADSITENIITALSYIPEMFVIARTSTSAYKGKAVKVKQVSEELGVQYVLEGSVMKAGDRIRVTAQLIDAISGHHLWADRYDREIEDFFDLLDEIAKKVAIELQVKLTEGDIARISHKTENFEAWAYATTAYSLLKRSTKENVAKAKELSEKAVKLDPKYGFAWGVLGGAHGADAYFGWGESRDKSFKLAVEYTDKALKLDETLSCATAVKGRLHQAQKQFKQAIAVGNRAIALGPSHNLSYGHLSTTMYYAGRFEESITLMKKAMRLDPRYPAWYIAILAYDYFHTERYEEAIEALKRVLERAQKGEFPPFYAHLGLSAAYMELGRNEEARAHAAEVLGIDPKFSLVSYAKTRPYKNKDDLERFITALRKAGLPDTPPLPLPDKPSIAVLAFDNLSGDPEQEYFSDGLTEEIITALSKVQQIFVIARNSTFTYKGNPVKVQQVGRELGVRYILEGSVRKSGENIRIAAQLIDASTGNHLWAERYDRDLKDIFAVQDEITKNIITAMQVKLTEGEQARAAAKGTNSLEAYLKCLQATENMYQMNIESNALARQLAEEAINIDPKYAEAYKTLGKAHLMDVLLGSSNSPKESLTLAIDLAQKALTLDDSLADAHSVLGFLYTMIRKHDMGIAEAELAVALDPNLADAYSRLGLVYRFAGMPEKAIPVIKKAIRLNPMAPGWYFYNLGTAYAFAGQCEEAIEACGKALQRETDNLLTHITTTVTYCLCEREKEAKAAAEGVLRINPKFSIKYFAKKLPYKNKADLDRYIAALRKVGLN